MNRISRFDSWISLKGGISLFLFLVVLLFPYMHLGEGSWENYPPIRMNHGWFSPSNINILVKPEVTTSPGSFTSWLPLVTHHWYTRMIAFDSDRDQDREIYLVSADGRELINLTNSPFEDWKPVWSPDGAKIVFISYREDKYGIYVMNWDGTGLTKLIGQFSEVYSLAWSPTGAKIAIVAEEFNNENLDIYLINPDGTGLMKIIESPGIDLAPSWSPDGTKIAFQSNRDGNEEVYVVNVDGSELRNLTQNSAADELPCIANAWSPDGKKIVFVSTRGYSWDVFTMNSDGSEASNLTISPNYDHCPAWSPDGTLIAYESFNEEHFNLGIFVMYADGTGATRLTELQGLPIWSSDGIKIAFEYFDGLQFDIFVMNADGSGIQNLTNHERWDKSIAWQP